MNYELKYLKYKMKYLNLLKNQSGGELKLEDLTVGESQIMYYGKKYTYGGEQLFTPVSKGVKRFSPITRIKLVSEGTEMWVPFENGEKFTLVVQNSDA
jgi:hypothetical protein